MDTTREEPTPDQQATKILNILFTQAKKERNLTQTILAELTGQTQSIISAHLSGRVSLTKKAVIAYAQAFGVAPGVIDTRLVYLNPHATRAREDNVTFTADENAPVLHDVDQVLAWVKNGKRDNGEAFCLLPALRGRGAFVMRGGDLNIPDTQPTDYLIIDPQERPKAGQHGLWILKGSLQAGTHRMLDGTLYLIPPPPFNTSVLLGGWDDRYIGRVAATIRLEA